MQAIKEPINPQAYSLHAFERHLIRPWTSSRLSEVPIQILYGEI